MRSGYPWRRAAGVSSLAAALLLTACGAAAPSAPAKPVAATPAAASSSPPATAAPAPKLTPVSLMFDWLVGGQHVGFIVAAARGYYKRVGLDVTMSQGRGSGVAVNTVASGGALIGDADATTVALSEAQGVPVKTIGVILQENPNCLFFHPGTKLTGPADLKGHTIIESAGDAFSHLLPATLAKGHLTPADVKVEVVDPSAKYAAFLSNPNAIMSGFATNDLPNLQLHEPNVGYVTLADWGYNAYSDGIIVTDATIAAHPGLLRRFMQATTEGWTYTAAHPAQAVKDVVKLYPNVNPQVLTKALAVTLKSLHTPATQGHPFGWMAASDWQQTLSLAHKYDGLKAPKPLADYYTNAFIDESATAQAS